MHISFELEWNVQGTETGRLRLLQKKRGRKAKSPPLLNFQKSRFLGTDLRKHLVQSCKFKKENEEIMPIGR